MYLALNTRQLLTPTSQVDSSRSIPVEYHLQSGRELYDKSIITADRYSSGAARWVVRCSQKLYNVTVVSRPYYSLPQELCVSFDCFVLVSKGQGEVNFISSWLPTEQVVAEFAVILSVFAREPLVLLGLRREDGEPVVIRPYRSCAPQFDKPSRRAAFGVDSYEFNAVLSGLASASKELEQAIIGASRFYHASLSLIGFDPSVAYVSFVSAVECLAAYHYADRKFDFDTVQKFERARKLIDQIARVDSITTELSQLKEELIRSEHFIGQKFRLFLTEFVTDAFWNTADELYDYDSLLPATTRNNFEQLLRLVYSARSEFIHGGLPFPEYVDFGIRQKAQSHVLEPLLELRNKQKFIP